MSGLSYRLDGPTGAPVVVLAGSLGTTAEMWRPQLETLAAFRVLRFDHPGHGGSDLTEAATVAAFAGRLARLLDALGIDRVSLCGLSLGGAVAMHFAAGAPERVERLVLACTAARFPNAEAYGERAAAVRANGMEPIADAIVGRWFTAAFRDAQPATVRRYRDMLVSTLPEGYARGCEAVRDFDARDTLGRVTAPSLVIAGADDPATTPEVCAGLADAIDGARLVVLDGAAHLANVEQPESFARALVSHLQS
ncbi:MAG TPA: 3-oxoadipate enol-lactonase [Gaiellaceae bacterium]|nr:3-oxoadipate enol-lactonase [Gaiellaceae bacterium]